MEKSAKDSGNTTKSSLHVASPSDGDAVRTSTDSRFAQNAKASSRSCSPEPHHLCLQPLELLPVRDPPWGPSGHDHVAVREEDRVVRVFVLLGREKHRDVHYCQDLVGGV